MKTFFKDWKLGVDFGILLTRFAIGFGLFYGHGMGKLSRLFSGEEIRFMDPIGLGETTSFILVAFAEGICGLLLIVGLLTRFAAIPAFIAMAVVVFVAHNGQPFGDIEVAFLYLLGSAALFFTGGGKFSLDRLFIK